MHHALQRVPVKMLQSLFPTTTDAGEWTFEPVLFRLVFHWVCILGVYRLLRTPPEAQASAESAPALLQAVRP